MKEWPRRRVGEIAQHSLGKMLDRAKNDGEPRPYLRNQNVRWFDFDLSDLNVMGFRPEEAAKCTALKGDVLICEGGNPGRAAIWEQDEPIHFQKAVHRVRFNDAECNRWFLYYLFMKDLDGSLRDHFSGTGIQHFTGEALDAFEIPLPSIHERRRIVAILDETFESITSAYAATNRAAEQAALLVEGVTDRLFSSPVGARPVAIREVATVFDGPHATPKTIDRGPIFLGISALKDGVVDLGRTRHVSADDFATWTRRVKPVAGDVAFAYETRLGQAAIIPDGLECCLGRRMGLIRTDRTRLDPRYLTHLYVSPPFRRFLEGKTVRGATVDRLSIRDFPSFEIPLPPMDVQLQLVERADSLIEAKSRLASIYERKLAALDELKRSLLHEAFAGNL